MDDVSTYHFAGPVNYLGDDTSYAGLILPKDIEAQMPFDVSPRLRVKGEMNGVPIEGAFVPMLGHRYIMVSKRLRAQMGIEIGDIVSFEFRIDDQNKVHTPAELVEIFVENPEAEELWEAWPAGKRRSLAYKFQRAKTAATRQKYAEQIIEELYNVQSTQGEGC